MNLFITIRRGAKGKGRLLGVVAALFSAIAFNTLTAGTASAAGTNIDFYSNGAQTCFNATGTADIYCLWFSPGMINGVWGTKNQNTGTITANFTQGDGAVRNNAASMANNTSNCNVTTWVSPNFVGDFNWLHRGDGGNLTSGSIPLRNNEASINANTCT